jgi:hypothetical protein
MPTGQSSIHAPCQSNLRNDILAEQTAKRQQQTELVIDASTCPAADAEAVLLHPISLQNSII